MSRGDIIASVALIAVIGSLLTLGGKAIHEKNRNEVLRGENIRLQNELSNCRKYGADWVPMLVLGASVNDGPNASTYIRPVSDEEAPTIRIEGLPFGGGGEIGHTVLVNHHWLESGRRIAPDEWRPLGDHPISLDE